MVRYYDDIAVLDTGEEVTDLDRDFYVAKIIETLGNMDGADISVALAEYLLDEAKTEIKKAKISSIPESEH